jgi:hypothetical protein
MTDNARDDSPDSSADEGITDEMLPEDLRPTDDNPLAKPLDEDAEDQGLHAPEVDGNGPG